jgi:hypothetical protein
VSEYSRKVITDISTQLSVLISLLGSFFTRTVVAVASYTVLVTDHLLAVQTTTIKALPAPNCVINLPAVGSLGAIFFLTVKDEQGDAPTCPILVTPNGVDKIDNVNAPITIASAYDYIRMYGVPGIGWFTF